MANKASTTFLNRRQWTRDFGLIGLFTGALAPFTVIGSPVFSLGAGLAGGVAGMGLGMLMVTILRAVRGRMPLMALFLLMPVLGLTWGGFAGAGGGLAIDVMSGGASDVVATGLVFGAFAGMVQMSWIFPLYMFQAVRKSWTWPVTLAGMLAAPLMGGMAFVAIGLLSTQIWMVVLPLLLLLGVIIERSKYKIAAEQASGGVNVQADAQQKRRERPRQTA